MVVKSSRITADKLRKILLCNQPVQSIDFRSADEFQHGHVAGSINVPLEGLQNGSATLNLDPKECIYLICTDASKADVAALILREMGFRDLRVLAGGLRSWSAFGFELENKDRPLT